MGLLPKSFFILFYRPLAATAFLIGLFLFVHFGIVERAQSEIASKESAWNLERPKIGRLTLLKTAQEDLIRFKETLPEETILPRLVSFISRLAESRRLVMPTISYQPHKTEAPEVAKIMISFSLKGDYREIRRFIYEIERSHYFLIIENVVLASSVKEGEKIGRPGAERPIELQLQMAAYLRPTETNEKAPRPGGAGTSS